MPLISIITITFNAEEFIERTIKSIQKQTNKNFEYLLIDGRSTDKTLSIVEQYKYLFDVIISEKDKGLYDAMNKGQQIAKGEYVWFINAGDEIFEAKATQKIEELANKSPDVIYGETNFTNNVGEILGTRSELTTHLLPDKLSWQMMKHGMLVCHQSFIAKRTIAPNYLKNNLSADIDWEINCLKAAKSMVKYDGILSNYLIGGISNRQLKKSLIDRFRVLKSHFGTLETLLAHGYILYRSLVKISSNKKKYW